LRNLIAVSIASLALAASANAAETPAAAPAKPAADAPMEMKNIGTPGQAVATRVTKVTAKVKAVDQAARTVTLEFKDGKSETLKVGPEVKRFAEVAAGDTIAVQFEQGLMLEYQSPSAPDVAPQAVATGGRAGAEEAPGGVVAAGVQATVVVTAIDMNARMVVFKGPRGNLFQVKAGPSVQLDRLKVGDKLIATYVEALAIGLEKAKPEAKKEPAKKEKGKEKKK
jgi:Cu/Ag efflux protein CusF